MKKTVIVTGATGNLGKAVTKVFLNADYRVIATGSKQHISSVPDHPNLEAIALDATDEKAVSDFVQGVINRYGNIDAALLLIGGFTMGSVENTGREEMQKMFLLNFYTAYFTARPVFNQMMKQKNGGKIIFMAAASALDDKQGFQVLPYILSKSLVVKLAKTLNQEGHHKHVQCSVIAPTIIDTPQNRAAMPDADFSNWTKTEEIAEVMAFVVSDKGNKMKDVVIKM